MATPLRALRSRSFQIFFAGQFIYLVGSWMQSVAMGWLVYRLTGSAWLLGVTTGVQQLPMLFLSPVAGVWADRANRRKLLVLIQSLAGVQAFTLAILTFSGLIEVSQLIALALLLGAIKSFETPTRQAFLLEMLETKQDLPNAIALQSMVFQAARFVGPSIAGLVLAASNEAWCFLLNGISYFAIVGAYAVIRVKPAHATDTKTEWWRQLLHGFRYAFGFLGTRRLLLLLCVMGLFGAPWSSLMPIFAAQTFGGDSKTYGFLISAVGMGAIIGTLFLALRASVRGLGRVVGATSITAGIALAAFALSYTLWLSLLLLAIFGFGLVVTAASTNTILQSVADEDKRARVISIYVMSFLGLAPIGNFVAGAVAESIGAHHTLFICGVVILIAGSAFAAGWKSWAQAVRPVYLKHGIIRPPQS